MQIGLFGGTFNPIHRGHLHAASAVRKSFKLDEIILIPTALPPHKTPVAVASAADRFEMINRAISGFSGITVSDVELQRSGPSYTIDTVYHFKDAQPNDALIYLIMGLDAFLEIDSWKSCLELLEQIPMIIMARPLGQHQNVRQGWQILEKYLKSKLSADYRLSDSQNGFISAKMQPIFICDVRALDISATRIRQNIKQKKPIKNWVPAPVEEYIYHKGLYR